MTGGTCWKIVGDASQQHTSREELSAGFKRSEHHVCKWQSSNCAEKVAPAAEMLGLLRIIQDQRAKHNRKLAMQRQARALVIRGDETVSGD